MLAALMAATALALLFIGGENSNPGANFYVSISDVPAKTEITEDNFQIVRLDLGEHSEVYLQPNGQKSNWILAKPLRAGELVPLSSLESSSHADCVAVKVNLGLELSSEIHLGDAIDLWAGRQNSAIEEVPTQIATSGQLLRKHSEADALGRNSQQVEICVSVAEIRSIVNSIARQDLLVAVKANG